MFYCRAIKKCYNYTCILSCVHFKNQSYVQTESPVAFAHFSVKSLDILNYVSCYHMFIFPSLFEYECDKNDGFKLKSECNLWRVMTGNVVCIYFTGFYEANSASSASSLSSSVISFFLALVGASGVARLAVGTSGRSEVEGPTSKNSSSNFLCSSNSP